MTLYTAGPWKDRDQVREIAAKLCDAGYKVNSRWLEVAEEAPEGMSRDEYMAQQAATDMEDVFKADALIYVNSRKSEGKATELGMAIALFKPIIVIGKNENNVFLNLGMMFFDTVELAIEWMKEEEVAFNRSRVAEVGKSR